MDKFSELILIENKRADVSSTGVFQAYVSTYGPPPDFVGDIIEASAFRDALTRHEQLKTQPALLWNHNTAEPVGVWLEFKEDSQGLLGTGRLTLGTRRGSEAAALMKDGALSMSIGFSIAPNGAETRNGIRYIKRISRLQEISLVALPANPKAKITNKARPQSPRECERLLRDVAGFSVKEAKRLTAGGYGALVRDEQGLTDLDRVLNEIEALKNELLRTR